MNEKKFSLERLKEDGMKCKTSEGHDVRVICTDMQHANQELKIIALIMNRDGLDDVIMYKEDGTNSCYPNLVNLPRKKQLWKNVYRNSSNTSILETGSDFYDYETAREYGGSDSCYVDTVLVYEWEE